MKRLAAIILLFSSLAFAQPRPELIYIYVPHDRQSRLLLEGERVDSIRGLTFTYNLGHEVITITAESSDSRTFLIYVGKGMKNVHREVLLQPKRKSIANTEFYIPAFTH